MKKLLEHFIAYRAYRSGWKAGYKRGLMDSQGEFKPFGRDPRALLITKEDEHLLSGERGDNIERS